ncbi:hypothetical protein QZH41_016575 [Actinostola sp. cb2023]|nr:hypothetical protein QZH41_016575 [Actinostola sp. cb2023]
MKLQDNVLRSFRVAKVFRENSDYVNHMSFNSNGESLITSSNDDSIVIYDTVDGKPKKTIYSKKYGVSNIQFTHAPNTVIHTSTKVDDTIRYLSLHDNKYLRYFPGHTKRVTTLNMSPIEDAFLSGSLDKTLRIWDLRSPNCQGLMHVNGQPIAAFDPEGLIFAAGIDCEMIKLYDLRSFDKGHAFSKGNHIDVCFSPDSQYVISGSQDGRVHIWASDSGHKITTLEGNHPGPTKCIAFNAKYMMLASACTNMAFWLPNLEELQDSS